MSTNEKGLIDLKNGQLLISCQTSSTEIKEFILPEEIWIMIWKYLDFKNLQKVCTQVSKSWLEMIRSSKLSWEMKLRDTFVGPDMLEVEDFNAMLSQWKDLRELQFSSEQDFAKFRLSLNSKKSLKKVVIWSRIEFDTKGPYIAQRLEGQFGFIFKNDF